MRLCICNKVSSLTTEKIIPNKLQVSVNCIKYNLVTYFESTNNKLLSGKH